MKTLHYRRHSIKDGAVKDTIGLNGLELAWDEGSVYPGANFDKVFHGPLVRTAQTALAYCVSYIAHHAVTPKIMPVVLEIGTEEIFRSIATEAFKALTKAGQNNFQAMLATYPAGQARPAAMHALTAVVTMFNQMENNQVAIAFGHSPMIELAAWAVHGFRDLPAELQKLGDLEGITFIQTDQGQYGFTEKICVQPDTTA